MIRNINQNSKYCYAFSKYEKIVSKITCGEQIKFRTQDAFSDRLVNENQSPSDVLKENVNPVNGPFYVENADEGDTLAIKIISIEPIRDWAVSTISREFGGGLVGTKMTRMLSQPLEDKVWIYKRQSDGSYYHSPKLHYTYEPFIGTIATSDKLEIVSSVTPYYLGGNMDVKDVQPGNILYLPIVVRGAYLYAGDCHARQGDGELTGAAIEMAADVVIEVDVIKNKKIQWPRIESKDEIMVVGSARPMEDAARIAYAELIEWLVEDYQWERIDAYHMLGQCGRMYLGNMVNPWYSMVAKVKKKYI